MEEDFQVFKYTKNIKSLKQKTFFISQDEFSYSNKKNSENRKTFHIGQLISIKKKRVDQSLTFIIKIAFNNDINLVCQKKTELEDLKKIEKKLLTNYILYVIKKFQFFYEKYIEHAFNSKEIKNKTREYIEKKVFEEIDNKLSTQKELIKSKCDILNIKFNEYADKLNEVLKSKKSDVQFEHMENILLSSEKEAEEDSNKNLILMEKGSFNLEHIDKLPQYYLKLVKILGGLKKFEIAPVQIKKEFLQDEEKIKAENNRLKNKLAALLNKNNAAKDKCKKKLQNSNRKLYLCFQCGNLLLKTNFVFSTCGYDDCCFKTEIIDDKAVMKNKPSMFYCKKCKINFCTSCVVFQSYLKCTRNHSLFITRSQEVKKERKSFQKIEASNEISTSKDSVKEINEIKEDDCGIKPFECFSCQEKEKKTPFYYCRFCEVALCQNCCQGMQVKEHSCWNCNGTFVWRKATYTECSKCAKSKNCYWNCFFCDYFLCLDCYPIFGQRCGAFHKLVKFGLGESAEMDEALQEKKFSKFKSAYDWQFNGKCSLCFSSMFSELTWGCTRCNLFLCEDCLEKLKH